MTPPTLGFLEPLSGSTVTTDSVSLRFTAADNRGVARFRRSINGGSPRTTYSGQSSATYNSGVWEQVPVQPGRNVIALTVFDVGLNTTTDSAVCFRAVPVASVTIAPSSVTVAVGATQQLSATLRDASSNILSGRTVAWSSSDQSKATVSRAGLVTGVDAGSSFIIAASEGKRDSVQVTVTATEQLIFQTVTAGNNFSCGLTHAGKAYCWGNNSVYGKLGDGTGLTRRTPTAVETSLTFVQISAGNRHVVALTPGGQAYAWGRNDLGLLGDGTTTDRLTPTAAQSSVHFTRISAGGDHNLALTAEG